MRLHMPLVVLAASCSGSPILHENSPAQKIEHIKTAPNRSAAPKITPLKYKDCSSRAAAVKEAFRFAWDGYYTYAFPNDDLTPISQSFENSRNGWGASAIDALSTAIIMDFDDIVDVILDHVATIDWYSPTDPVVSVFETTIRYLGGMLSGYDLLKGPYAHLVKESSKVDVLLSQAKALADALSPAFDTPTGIPDNMIDITTGERLTTGSETGLAVAGTLVLEWTRLSDLLGDPSYGELAQRAEAYLLQPSYAGNLSEPFPGMEGTDLNYNTGQFTSVIGGWNGGTDSFYEYLLKQWVYSPGDFDFYRQRWETAVDSTTRYLKSSPSSRPELTFVAAYNATTLQYQSSHLAGFIGGNFILGGITLGRDDYIRTGLEFTHAWHDTYMQDTPQIGPETFQWLPVGCPAPPTIEKLPKTKEGRVSWFKPENIGSGHIRGEQVIDPSACTLAPGFTAQADFYAKSGFFVSNNAYMLRPEVLESYYYAYRVTSNPLYQDWAWEAFQAINASARVGVGFSSFKGLNSEVGITYDDHQESFLFAETLKYAYIIFAGKHEEWQVDAKGCGNKTQEWVFNTEAHPLKVRGTAGASCANSAVIS